MGCIWVTRCIRSYIVVPNTWPTRAYCVAYDLVFSRSFLRNNLVLMWCSVQGFQNNNYFALMLLDVLNNSSLLAATIQCMVIPAPSLGMIFYLLACSSVLYAQFGLANFETENWAECHSAMSCFWMIVYRAVPSKNMFGSDVTSNRGVEGRPDFMLRMLFDLVWFIWNFLLFRIMTGLIFSTFGKLRAEESARSAVLNNVGFVSGLERGKYSDMNIKSAPTYDALMAGTQNHWRYVSLLLHLRKKNPVDYTGCEAFVKRCLDAKELHWLPSKTSSGIQKAGRVYDAPPGSDLGAEAAALPLSGKRAVAAAVGDFVKTVEAMRREVEGLGKQVGRLEETTHNAAEAAERSAKNPFAGGAALFGGGGGGGGGLFGGFGGREDDDEEEDGKDAPVAAETPVDNSRAARRARSREAREAKKQARK